MSDVDLDDYSIQGQASYIQHADIIESQPFLRPNFGVESEEDGLNTGSNGKLGQVRAYVPLNKGTKTMYAIDYGDNGDATYRIGFFAKTTFAATQWTDTANGTDADATPEPDVGGAVIADDDTILFADSNGGSGLSVGKVVISTTTVTIGHDILTTSAWGGSGSGNIKAWLNHTDGETYVLAHNLGGANQSFLGVYDTSSKFSGLTPASFPVNYEGVDMISYGNKILAVANSSRGDTSKLFIRDPYQTLVYTFDDIYDIKIHRVQAIRIVKGRVIIISADYDYKIWEWTGGDNVNLLKVLNVGAYNSLFKINNSAVDVKDGILYFGTACGVSTFNNGVYAFGFNDDGSTFLYNVMTDDENDASNVEYRALRWYDDGTSVGMFVTSKDVTNGTYNNMEYVIGASRSANLIWDSVWMRPFPGLKSQIIKASLYHEDGGSGSTITLASKVDDDDNSFTTRFVADTNGVYKTVVGVNNFAHEGSPTISNAFPAGQKHKLRITMTSGAQLEKIKLRVRTKEIE